MTGAAVSLSRSCGSALMLILMSLAAFAQTSPIDLYLAGAGGNLNFLGKAPANRTVQEVDNILPLIRQRTFADYVNAKLGDDRGDLKNLLDAVSALRLNKLVGSTTGPVGTTSLLSRVAAPAVLGIGVEYGGILQQNTGATTTLRANLLGVSRMVFGEQQFPYCPVLDEANCRPDSRHLRRFSASTSFENIRATTGTAMATPLNPAASTPAAMPIITELFGHDFRMANWGIRFDVTPSNNLDDPGYLTSWRGAIAELRQNEATKALPAAVQGVFDKTVEDDSYNTWNEAANAALRMASDERAFRLELEKQLDLLIEIMKAKDPNFRQNILDLRRAYTNYFTVRDDLLQKIQSHKMSVEYTNQHPQGQFSTSNVRFIYSHQPTNSPTLITVNAAATFYNSLPAGAKGAQLRDVQLAGQLDRRLSQIPKFGYAVATFAGYYQWMKNDALIAIGPDNIAPGSSIVLPGTAATLLRTKGHIGIVQGKLSIPAGAVMKIPLSITWSNRTELIKEKDIRAQAGITMDFDSLFH